MGKVIITGSGGGAAGSDECTATRAEVLKGFQAITKDSDDELIDGTLELVGTAADSQVLTGQSYYNTDAKTKRTGTMVNRGAVSSALNAGSSYTIPAGYHNGSGRVTANSLASQTSGNATAAQIYNGYTAWVNGSKVTGTMPAMGGQTITPGAAQQTVNCAGKYMMGNIVVQGGRLLKTKDGSLTSSSGTLQFVYGGGLKLYHYYVDIPTGFTPVLVVAFGERDSSTAGSGGDVNISAESVCGFLPKSANPNIIYNANTIRIPVVSRNAPYWYHIAGY